MKYLIAIELHVNDATQNDSESRVDQLIKHVLVSYPHKDTNWADIKIGDVRVTRTSGPTTADMKAKDGKFKRATLSIDRASKSFALFDGFDIVQDFQLYATEEEALASARQFFGSTAFEIAYPRITSMRMTTGRRRR
jgi:hypothetical protein